VTLLQNAAQFMIAIIVSSFQAYRQWHQSDIN